MEKTLPDREQLLSDIFEIVKSDGPIRLNEISESSALNDAYSQTEINIALCMLEGRGLVHQFSKEADEIEKIPLKRRAQAIEFYFAATAIEKPTEPDTKPPAKRTCWQFLRDFIFEE